MVGRGGKVSKVRKVRTKDLGGTSKTYEMGDEVVRKIQEKR